MGLSKNTIRVVQQTVPALRDRGEDITTRMYEILFSKHPETEALFKNAANQNVKLAKAIVAYAENIEHLDQLSETLNKLARRRAKAGRRLPSSMAMWQLDEIAQRHVKAGVKPEHYPLVGDALMSAIVDVLGRDVITDEVAAAWTEAYNHLAGMLQAREAILYAAD